MYVSESQSPGYGLTQVVGKERLLRMSVRAVCVLGEGQRGAEDEPPTAGSRDG